MANRMVGRQRISLMRSRISDLKTIHGRLPQRLRRSLRARRPRDFVIRMRPLAVSMPARTSGTLTPASIP